MAHESFRVIAAEMEHLILVKVAELCKLLKDLEAAIGIEPMNKGFAVLPGHLSLSIMECDRPVFVDLFRDKHGTGPGEFDVV
jgi:hypothetical protein